MDVLMSEIWGLQEIRETRHKTKYSIWLKSSKADCIKTIRITSFTSLMTEQTSILSPFFRVHPNLTTPTRPGLGVHDVTVRLHLRCLALFFSTSIEIETVSPGVVVIRNAFALLCCNWLLTQRILLPILSRGICWHFCGSEGEHKRVDLSLARKKVWHKLRDTHIPNCNCPALNC